MSRKATEIQPNHLNAIKNSVLEKYNKPLIRSVDCDDLANDISTNTNNHINGITFKRLFGFTKYPFNPSIQTLDILAQYVDCANWYDFINSLADLKPISAQELDILVSFFDFDLINKIEYHDGGIQSMSRKIALRFRQDPLSFKQAIKRLAPSKYAQIFFIEHFPDYDHLCNYYYLIYEEYLKYKNSSEGQIFGNCMLFLKSFWLMKSEDSLQYITNINACSIHEELHPFIVGRFYSCNLLFEHFYGKKEQVPIIYDKYLEQKQHIRIGENHFKDFPASEYIVSEALLHCKMYQECIDLVNITFIKYDFKIEFVRKGYYRQMLLFKAYSLYYLGELEQSKDILRRINPSIFYFISEKYYTTLYLSLKYKLFKNKNDLLQARQNAQEMNNNFLLHYYL